MTEEDTQFEVARTEKPMSQAELIFQAISKALKEPAGSIERSDCLADVQSLLAPQADSVYEDEVKAAKAGEKDENNGSRITAADFQAMWLAAMMKLMKRMGMLGSEYVSG